MKISVVTPTYNRAKKLEKLYTSLLVNSNSDVEFEWVVIDDGSTDKTRLIIENYIKQGLIDIQYHYQNNMGKMAALNNAIDFVKGDIVFTCDSDDCIAVGAFDIIKKHSSRLLNDETVYALAFLKKNSDGTINGNEFTENFYRTDMFGMAFRDDIEGEKILVFRSDIRRRFRHELEADEKFVTEARMYHKMDLDYDIIGINEAIEVGDYEEDGYTRNIDQVFLNAPLGYYEYFKEILEMNLKGVKFKKKMYIYKQYILFSNLAEREKPILNVKGIENRLMILLLWIPGKIATKRWVKNHRKKDKK